jgi:type II secretory pathway component HofQ
VVTTGVTGGNVQWKEFGIKTEVLPKIQQDDFIEINITTEVSRLDWANAVLNFPAISKREANANVRIKNGQTIVLAGMIETKKDDTMTGIPLLMDIPVIGRLFGRKIQTDIKNNILIFVTPKILEQ